MIATTRWRGSASAARAAVVVTSLIALLAVGATLSGPAAADGTDAAKPISHTATWTQEETVTVTETATVDGFTGTGQATATASATVEATGYGDAEWEAYYYAYWNAAQQATDQAREKAESEARPVARQRAEDDARAQAAAAAEAARPRSHTATWTQEESVTVTETVTIDGFTGTGRASATASATVTVTHTAATDWEAYYYAYWGAAQQATDQAREKAESEARPVARQRAEDDARAQAAAAAEAAAPVEHTATMTAEKTVTRRESFTIGDVVGHGEATETATATVTHTEQAETLWEAYYWAVVKAQAEADRQAEAEATERARAEALRRAEADARAKVEADEGSASRPGGTPDCGPQVLKGDGTPWTCTLSENFRGTELDRDLWVPQLTSATGWQAAGECFVDDEDSLSVGGGVLSITTRRTAEPFTCDSPEGAYESRWRTASLSTVGTFSQAYGRFEFRAKFPDVKVPGIHSALWMWPDDDTRYGLWPLSGEIDVAEIYSANPDRAVPMLHYGAPMGEQGTGRTNQQCLLDPTQWNTYVAEWTPEGITISYGGEVCVEHRWNPLAPLSGSQPFDQPFMLAITQGIGIQDNAATDDTPDVSTMLVDHVRVWS